MRNSGETADDDDDVRLDSCVSESFVPGYLGDMKVICYQKIKKPWQAMADAVERESLLEANPGAKESFGRRIQTGIYPFAADFDG